MESDMTFQTAFDETLKGFRTEEIPPEARLSLRALMYAMYIKGITEARDAARSGKEAEMASDLVNEMISLIEAKQRIDGAH
jgi:hypothetical protein